MRYTVTVHEDVVYIGDYLVVNEKKTYKVIAQDGNTLTIAHPNFFVRLWDRLDNWIIGLNWKIVEKYYDVTDWIMERIEDWRKRD